MIYCLQHSSHLFFH